jgi:hypothetical protein
MRGLARFAPLLADTPEERGLCWNAKLSYMLCWTLQVIHTWEKDLM